MGFKIIYNKKNCIGAGECENLSRLWKLNNSGKADLSKSKETRDGIFELTVDDDEGKQQKRVASSCPAGCIKVVQD